MNNNEIKLPKDGLAGLAENWKTDLGSGFLVFLIALPLCLGIAMASGFPPIGGILSAVVGGLIVGPIMGSKTTIKGPAAGLIAIVAAAVIELGDGDAMAGYRYTLAIIAVSGLIQVVFGMLKLGKLVYFFPSAAVHGMLAAIGIIIIAKQVPVLLGTYGHHSNPIALLIEIPEMVMNLNPEIALIGLTGLLILFGLPRINISWVRKIPAPMLVLLVAVPMGLYFDLEHQHKYLFLDHQYFVGPEYLVTLPNNFLDGIVLPDFAKFFTFASFKYLVMLALVGSLESLLTVKAIDSHDPFHRKSDTNRDLLALGVGNTVNGMIGGFPMISEVVRSSANVNNGAKTRWANIFHGGFLLLFVAFFPNLLHQIPLGALAAMLIYTGYRLASPSLFIATLKVGKEQLAIFLVTIVVTLAEDLLVGIFAGVLLKIVLELRAGVPLKYLFRSDTELAIVDGKYIVKAIHATIFSNYLGFKKYLDRIPEGQQVVIDLALAEMVDHTFMEEISHFKHDYEQTGGHVEIIGLEHFQSSSGHELASRRAIRLASVK